MVDTNTIFQQERQLSASENSKLVHSGQLKTKLYVKSTVVYKRAFDAKRRGRSAQKTKN